jgi:aspartokinase
MVTVQHLVKKEMENNPVLADILQQELVNISALALKLQPTIMKEMGKDVKASAIGMALRRYVSETSGNPIYQWKFPKNLEISTKSQIYEVAIEKSSRVKKILDHLFDSIKRQKGEFISFVEGTYEIVIFTNQKNKEYVREAIKKHTITSECDNLAYVTVNWEKITKDIPGIYYRLTRALAFKNISIQSFHTVGAEMIILFKEEVLVDAYQVLGNLLHNKTKL